MRAPQVGHAKRGADMRPPPGCNTERASDRKSLLCSAAAHEAYGTAGTYGTLGERILARRRIGSSARGLTDKTKTITPAALLGAQAELCRSERRAEEIAQAPSGKHEN